MSKRFKLKSKLRGRIYEGTFIVDDDDAAKVRQMVLGWARYDTSPDSPVIIKRDAVKGLDESLARILLGAKEGEIVMYIDGDHTNLRRSNLTAVTASERAVMVNTKRWAKQKGEAA